MSKPKATDEKPADVRITQVRVTQVCIVGGIRREPGDWLVRDDKLTDGVTEANLALALMEQVAEFVP